MKKRFIVSVLFSVAVLGAYVSAISQVVAEEASKSARLLSNKDCVDDLIGRVIVDPNLDSSFFRTTQSSYPWHIVEHEDGSIEDTFGGEVSKKDLKKTQHTADCVSTHQGQHLMNFAEAENLGDKLIILLSGGMPAYASSLSITIEKGVFTCKFEATYPGPLTRLNWRIKKKELRVKTNKFDSGSRLFAWLSVEFEESRMSQGKVIWTPYKIEGFIKPIILSKS
jgi:hypothetical protein